ncbi:hypothetical protein C6Y14_38430 [Streptomyces dioscori]|uniref:Uncharacterized protein n=1 Tax=Streptomyces dioscori TaxID=2109333 RepID=A0A2P8PW45_9ACTN|nr:hypothetical protein C6Y14_38430 [Streptomyces dioscori]
MTQEAGLGRAGHGSAVVELLRMLNSGLLRTLLADDRATDLVGDFADRTYRILTGAGKGVPAIKDQGVREPSAIHLLV